MVIFNPKRRREETWQVYAAIRGDLSRYLKTKTLTSMKQSHDYSSEFSLFTTLSFAFILARVLFSQIGRENTKKTTFHRRFSTVLKRSTSYPIAFTEYQTTYKMRTIKYDFMILAAIFGNCLYDVGAAFSVLC